MNRYFIALSALIIGIAAAPQVHADPVKVAAYFENMYIPGGYDSNDLIQIVGEGKFHNSCFRHAETNVRIDEDQQKIYLGPVAYSYPGICLMVILPYQKTIDVGILKAGKWEIVQDTNKKVVGEISVRSALTKSADDYLYAPISQAYFYQVDGFRNVMLTGEFSNSCMQLDQVKFSTEPNVIAVQPIAKMEQRSDCQDGKFPFKKNVTLNSISAGRYLLHVRSLNGNAINSLIDVK